MRRMALLLVAVATMAQAPAPPPTPLRPAPKPAYVPEVPRNAEDHILVSARKGRSTLPWVIG